MNLCDLTRNFSNFKDATGLGLISRKSVRQIIGFAILACANFSITWFNCEFKISVLSMQTPTSSSSGEQLTFAMKAKRLVKEQGTSHCSVRGKQVVVESSSESEQEEVVYEPKSKSAKGLAVDLMHPM